MEMEFLKSGYFDFNSAQLEFTWYLNPDGRTRVTLCSFVLLNEKFEKYVPKVIWRLCLCSFMKFLLNDKAHVFFST